MSHQKLYRVKDRDIWNLSGVNIPKIHGRIDILKKEHYRVLDFPVGGDAPKEFIQVYKYGEASKKDIENWSKFIAKVGHKWYPIESITEYLMNRIGEVCGLKMAKSELRIADEQIRFLSKYFLAPDELMMHGAQMYSTYLNEIDTGFVDEIEEKQLSRQLLTFKVSKLAIESLFPNQASQIMESFVKLLAFDAFTGNNDRHFYNWAVVTDLRNIKAPYFSPIYDTARGLFWNSNEDKIASIYKDLRGGHRGRFNKYIKSSQPKIGWADVPKNFNHFDLIEKIVNNYPQYSVIIKEFLIEKKLKDVILMIDKEFNTLLTENRLYLITECLKTRFEKLSSL